MRGFRTLRIVVGTLGACSGLIWANLGFAAVQDSRFAVSPDGTTVDFDVRDVPRREVLNRLFAEAGIELKWLDAVFADELITGTFNGTPFSVARQLLARTNFVIAYDDNARVARVVVVGPASGEQASPGLAAIAAAMQPSSQPKASSKAELPIAAMAQNNAAGTPAKDGSRTAPDSIGNLPVMSELGTGVDATPVLRPPPPGETAPQLVSVPGAPALIPPSPGIYIVPPLMPVTADTPAGGLPLKPAPAGAAAPILDPIQRGGAAK
jgi:hypothetical protein